ncbi:glycosyltransferase [Enterovirga sp.]|uniref:glycosyltransferase n=1 Tax=Enterovirga sp. TaxID=2026350 RepID=UPI0026259790|nr:glycosyltransferase [Enterovirga sp.]
MEQLLTRRAGTAERPLLLCFSHLRWDFVWQRPQHLLVRAARRHDVAIMEEPIYADGVEPHLDVSERPGGIRILLPVLPWGIRPEDETAAQRRLLDRFLAAEKAGPAVLWYYTPLAMEFSAHVTADVVVYDNMDELSAFRGASPRLLDCEDALFRRADLVFTGGYSLWEAKRDRHPRVTALPSSIDAHHFAAARLRHGDGLADQAHIGRPRLGFFGVIDERMDLDLVREVAARRPDWNLVMLGPVAKIDPATLPQAANIHWIGARSYAELPAYLASWDVGIMPFALNESTRFISPTKTPEYLAAGVPVVSTRIKDVVRPYGDEGLVAIADTPDELVAMAAAAMARPREPWLAAVDLHLANGSWDSTWEVVQRSLDEVRAARPLQAAGSVGRALSA